MLELIGVDGLTQWDVGRQINVDKDIDMVHFSNRPYGYSKNVKVTNGVADVPDMFLTSCAPLRVWAYVGNFEKGYTKIEKIYEVKPKNRPEDYIYTPEEVKTWEKLQSEIGDLAGLKTEAKENLVVAINEAAKSGGESYTLPQATSEALGGVKADPATADDTQPVRINDSGKLVTAAGADGKSAYQYAQDGGYTGTETEFAKKLAKEIPEALPNPNALTLTGAVNATYDGSTAVSVEIPSGGSGGTDISLGLTSAAVGQTIKVKAVDESGKPTAWEAADLPKPDEYVVLFHKTFETAVANTDEWGGESHQYGYRHFWTIDTNGNAVYADGIFFRIHVPAQTDNIVNSGELNVLVGQRAVTSWMSWSADEAKPYIGWASFVMSSGQEVWAEQNFDLREQIFSGTRATNQTYMGNFYGANTVRAVPFSYALGLRNIEYFSGVQINLVSGGFPAGTEILVYARKYDANKIKNIPKWGAT